jgi:hypothetical protein
MPGPTSLKKARRREDKPRRGEGSSTRATIERIRDVRNADIIKGKEVPHRLYERERSSLPEKMTGIK